MTWYLLGSDESSHLTQLSNKQDVRDSDSFEWSKPQTISRSAEYRRSVNAALSQNLNESPKYSQSWFTETLSIQDEWKLNRIK